LSCPGISESVHQIDLGKDAKSGVITVTNESSEKLQVQMRAFEWSQDAEGNDRYEETQELIFFPKLMELDRNEQKILRAGIKIPATAKEKTYRLFIAEIPVRRKAEGSQVAIAVRFGVPIFVKPLKEEPKGELGKMVLSQGTVKALVKNTGNRHFIIDSVHFKGKKRKGEISQGDQRLVSPEQRLRMYSASMPPEICKDTVRIDMEVKTSGFLLTGTLDPTKICLP
jgi:fimbrial chaperone protein